MAQNVRVMVELANRKFLQNGTFLEIVPTAMPRDGKWRDLRVFRAKVGDTNSPKHSIIWEFDGKTYSPTTLTCKLWRDYGVQGEPMSRYPSYFSYWRIVGQEQSLWEIWKEICAQESTRRIGLTPHLNSKVGTNSSKKKR